MKGTLLKRRTNMLKMTAEAYPLVDIVNVLSAEYAVSKQAIYKDWRNRGSWQTQLLELGSLSQLCKDLYATHKQLYTMAVQAYREAEQDTAKIGALRLLRDLNLDFATMFPNVIDIHVKGSKGDDINALLRKYQEIYEEEGGSGDKTISVRWNDIPVIDVRKFTGAERDRITAACRLLGSHTDRTLVKLADGSNEIVINPKPEGIDVSKYTEEELEKLREAAQLMERER